MKFTDSPVIELQVRDSHLSIQQDNGSFHVGTSVWPCSLVLAKFVERWAPPSPTTAGTSNPYSELLDFHSRRRRAIELGTGCGAAGMAFHLLGLHDIILTDISPVMPALKHNLKRNKPVLGKNLKTSILYWNNKDQIRAANPPFDLVIAADVVYIEESLRSPEADKLFWEMCENVFVIDKVPHQDLHPDYAYEETDVYVFRKKNSN
ncbi:C2H2 and C2HC zinc fingers superfamily protein [Hibiscus syriacus]|uniref:C2H2 and C2HC zinc fingers superfamily protein n=1 Tax=Hibiscus syriacus TaxID=106335 RepID=A0A6A3BIG4_HIBSY|nr:C2H2 and C2HC zinc fingers superfamily protein [Hibiscus syriacus]